MKGRGKKGRGYEDPGGNWDGSKGRIKKGTPNFRANQLDAKKTEEKGIIKHQDLRKGLVRVLFLTELNNSKRGPQKAKE